MEKLNSFHVAKERTVLNLCRTQNLLENEYITQKGLSKLYYSFKTTLIRKQSQLNAARRITLSSFIVNLYNTKILRSFSVALNYYCKVTCVFNKTYLLNRIEFTMPTYQYRKKLGRSVPILLNVRFYVRAHFQFTLLS